MKLFLTIGLLFLSSCVFRFYSYAHPENHITLGGKLECYSSSTILPETRILLQRNFPACIQSLLEEGLVNEYQLDDYLEHLSCSVDGSQDHILSDRFLQTIPELLCRDLLTHLKMRFQQ